MEKETQRKNQKSLIKNVLINIGIVAASALTVSVIMLKINNAAELQEGYA